jgi:hypothetical protein
MISFLQTLEIVLQLIRKMIVIVETQFDDRIRFLIQKIVDRFEIPLRDFKGIDTVKGNGQLPKATVFQDIRISFQQRSVGHELKKEILLIQKIQDPMEFRMKQGLSQHMQVEITAIRPDLGRIVVDLIQR